MNPEEDRERWDLAALLLLDAVDDLVRTLEEISQGPVVLPDNPWVRKLVGRCVVIANRRSRLNDPTSPDEFSLATPDGERYISAS